MAPKPGTVTFTDQALKNLANMRTRVDQIRNQFGQESEQYLKALASLNFVVVSIIAMGGNVSAEDDLNLMLDSYIYCGIIFHKDRSDSTELAGEWSIHS